MKILLICRTFAPDNIISAKRLTKFAKYLQQFDNDVTVICSGVVKGKYSKSTLSGLEDVKVFYYNNTKPPVPNNQICEEKPNSNIFKSGKNKSNTLVRGLKRLAHLFYDPVKFFLKDGKEVKERILDLYYTNKSIRGYDIIVSTFSPIGCLQAGYYIKKQEQCKWVVDFRDLMTNKSFSPLLRAINYFVQKHYVNKADACFCVSEGNCELLKKMCTENSGKIYTIYNGYDCDEIYTIDAKKSNDSLILCYTGSIHKNLQDFSVLFKALKKMDDDGKRDVFLWYAGKDGKIIKEQASKYGMETKIIDFGLLTKEEVRTLQQDSDVFLVASWNKHNEKGILTGKFYESLAAKMPVIGIVMGNEADSELGQLIESYNLGFCYEQARHCRDEKNLEEYLKYQYITKLNKGKVIYNPDEEAFGLFCYENIVQKLNVLLEDVVGEI